MPNTFGYKNIKLRKHLIVLWRLIPQEINLSIDQFTHCLTLLNIVQTIDYFKTRLRK